MSKVYIIIAFAGMGLLMLIQPSSAQVIYCGAQNGGAVCYNNLCCSRFGYCGLGPDYCCVNSGGCQVGYGACMGGC
ncbi:hypothetical protein C8236_09225 [Paracidovorax avenae]|nr:hypothetical protein C8232_06735 [Paracidovorax avenae]AVS98988.1 hypothetical protein C8236_09225 [Paracidovorax avenae]AVT02681.1 hypothetical protein C8243_09385 [Paracidovorax avenae]AVT09513.1 hypothetical protein C8242_08435 [Paracidovorax avenae]